MNQQVHSTPFTKPCSPRSEAGRTGRLELPSTPNNETESRLEALKSELNWSAAGRK